MMNNPFTMHILITSLCDRNCKYCCNKQYDLSKIPYPTKEEFEKTELVCLTGGEPFKYSRPNEIAHYLKDKFNVKKIIVYTNAYEFVQYLIEGNYLNYIDGVTVSIKNQKDKKAWESLNFNYWRIKNLNSNLLYVFPGFEDIECPNYFQKQKREWQTTFKPAENSIFRRL